MHPHPSLAAQALPRKPCHERHESFCLPNKKKGGGAPIGAPCIGRTTLADVAACKCSGRGSGPSGDRSPLGAPRRHLPRKSMPWLSPGRASCRRENAGVTRIITSACSGAPRTPVVMPEGTIPGPPGSGVTSPARRNRTRPVSRPSPATPLRWARFDICS
jgi:hypothetical protein